MSNPNDRVEIIIITGPGGSFIGSQITIDGKELKRLKTLTLQASVGERWTLQTDQVIMPDPELKSMLLEGSEDA